MMSVETQNILREHDAAGSDPLRRYSSDSNSPRIDGMGSSTTADPANAAGGLISAMRDLTADANYKMVADIFYQFIELKERNNDLNIANRMLMEEYRIFRNELESEKKKLIEGEKILINQVQTKDKEILELGSAKAVLENEKGELEDRVRAKDRELGHLNTAKEKLEAEKAGLENSLQETTKSLQDMTTERDTLATEKTDLQAKLEEKTDELAEVSAARDKLIEEKATLETTVQEKTKEIEDLTAAKATLEDEKIKLEEQVQGLTTSLEEEKKVAAAAAAASAEEIASLKATVQEREDEVKELKDQLASEQERATTAEGTIETLQGKLKEVEDDLEKTQGNLSYLQRYRVELVDEPEDNFVNILDTIWTNVIGLVETTFRQDLDDQVISDPTCWSNLRTSDYLKHVSNVQVPIPQSNTPSGKGMRIAAVLAVLSRALSRYIFRPTYLMDNDDNLVGLLHEMDNEDPTWEQHVRATLLRMMPDSQVSSARKRVNAVVHEVSWVVQGLLTPSQFEGFAVGLENAARVACEEWTRIQTARTKIEVYFGPPYDDFDWQVLELPEFERDGSALGVRPFQTPDSGVDVDPEAEDKQPAVDGNGETGNAEGDTAADGGGGGGGGGDGDGGGDNAVMDGDDDDANSEASSELEPSDILLVVWPCLCAVDGGELSCLTQGLVIAKDQARQALAEVRSRMGPRRNSMRRARSMSMAGRSRSVASTRSHDDEDDDGDNAGEH